jgi:protein SCO1/2
MSRTLTGARLLCALILAFGAPTLAHDDPVQRSERAAAGWPVGAFTLVDHRGEQFTQDRLRGRWTFVLFGDTRCADPCTATLSALDGLVKRIAGTAAVKTTQVLFVSLDPERDTPPRLRQHLARYGERFIGASGPRSTLKQLVDETGVAVTVAAAPGLHAASTSTAQPTYSGSAVLIGPDGAIRVEYLPPFDIKRLTAEFLKVRVRG